MGDGKKHSGIQPLDLNLDHKGQVEGKTIQGPELIFGNFRRLPSVTNYRLHFNRGVE